MQLTLDDVLGFIQYADDLEIGKIMEAVRERFSAAFPDWEVIYLSCPKNDPNKRKQTLEILSKYFDA